MSTHADLINIAKNLKDNGRSDEALVICRHVVSESPHDLEANIMLASILMEQGLPGEALKQLVSARENSPHSDLLLHAIQQSVYKASEKYNDFFRQGLVKEATRIACAIADAKENEHTLSYATKLSLQIGNLDDATKYGRRLLFVRPMHALTRFAVAESSQNLHDKSSEIENRLILAFSNYPDITTNIHNISRLLYVMLSEFETKYRYELIDALTGVARSIWSAEETLKSDPHYTTIKFMASHISHVDFKAMACDTAAPSEWPAIRFSTPDGTLVDIDSINQTVVKEQATAMIFVAADDIYIDRFGGIFLKWVLKHLDMRCLIVIHAIGGYQDISKIAAAVGIDDPLLFYSGCEFDKEGFKSTVGVSSFGDVPGIRPYYQSARFLWLDFMMEKFNLPILVSDIDMLLQRGLKDLFEIHHNKDVVFRKVGEELFGHYAANLLLINPTKSAASFSRALRAFLLNALKSKNVPVGIDQLGLLMARCHLLRNGEPLLAQFSPEDNNLVLTTDYPANPYRFYSLHTWFDTAILPEP